MLHGKLIVALQGHAAHEVMYMGYVICKVTFANHHRTTGQSQSHMHVEKISFNPTHSTTILSTLNFETGTTGRNRYIYIHTCYSCQKSHLDKLKVASACTCISPKPTVQGNKERRNSTKYKQYKQRTSSSHITRHDTFRIAI
jgi:hypothetical protein